MESNQERVLVKKQNNQNQEFIIYTKTLGNTTCLESAVDGLTTA